MFPVGSTEGLGELSSMSLWGHSFPLDIHVVNAGCLGVARACGLVLRKSILWQEEYTMQTDVKFVLGLERSGERARRE
jgi:hypothetical protein